MLVTASKYAAPLQDTCQVASAVVCSLLQQVVAVHACKPVCSAIQLQLAPITPNKAAGCVGSDMSD